jgi:hypothetical protein
MVKPEVAAPSAIPYRGRFGGVVRALSAAFFVGRRLSQAQLPG